MLYSVAEIVWMVTNAVRLEENRKDWFVGSKNHDKSILFEFEIWSGI